MLNPADATFAQRLAALLPPDTVGPAEPRHLEEPRGRARTPQAVLARPRSVEEIATILRACASARVGLVPYGGGTGLVLGQVAPDGPAPLILSLERMNNLRGIWPEEGLMIVEAGMTLAAAQEAAQAAGRLFPLSLASEGTARIGGVLATNAGGVNVLRYGNARELCLGIEAVMADGSVLHGLKRLRKDNTGYDLKDLLIGSEGTLGIITAAVLRLWPIPAGRATALVQVPSPEAALSLLSLAQDHTGGNVTSFELIGGQGLHFLREAMPELRQPFDPIPDWSALVELGLPRGVDPASTMETILQAGAERALLSDGVIAQSESQARALWTLRESIPLANRRIGAIVSHDIAVPLGEIGNFVREATQAVGQIGPFRVNCFGHLGDGNLHFNVFPPAGASARAYRAQADEIQRRVHDLVDRHGGSISAEHGIGRIKRAELERYGDPTKLAAMRAIKSALDPMGILNPGAVLRP